MSAVRALARVLSFGALALAAVPAVSQALAGFAASTATKVPSGSATTLVSSTGTSSSLKDVFGDTAAERTLEQSLSPYLTISAADNKVLLQPLSSTGTRRAFSLGSSLVVMTPAAVSEDVPMTLPEGHWVNFWTGAQSMGGATFTAELPAGSLPIWARGGSVIERRSGGYNGLFEKRLTDQATNCGDNCLLDLMPAFNLAGSAVIRDADGRSITRSRDTLAVQGKPARMTVRWRFTRVADVRVNGAPVQVQSSPEGYYASFDHADVSSIEWAVRDFMPRSY